MKKYGVIIVGTGWMSGEHIRAFEMTERTQVMAIVSHSRERGEAKIWEYGLGSRYKVCTDYQEGLRDPNVDIVVICTPNDMYCEQTILAAEAGEHILIEKPAVLTWEDTKRIDEAARKVGVKTLVGYVLHYNPLLVTVKKIQKDFIGELKYAEIDYFHRVMDNIPCYQWACEKSVGGSSLLAGDCHAVDAMWWSMQDEVVSVYAQSNKIRTDLEFDGTISIILKFKNGVVGKVGNSYDFISPYVFNLYLCGTKGTLWNEKLWSSGQVTEQRDHMKLSALTPNSGDVEHHPFLEGAVYLLGCIIHDRKTDRPTSDTVKTQEIVLAADLSTAAGEVVHLSLK